MALQPIIMPILSLFRSAGISQARQAIFGLNKDFTHFAQTIGKSAAAFAAFQGLAGARQFTIDAVENTQKFERNMLALQQVFEQATPSLRSFVKEVENYGLSQSQAAQASVFIGSVLKQYGFTVDEASSQTQRLVTLAQDLATTYGYDVQEALLAITALFRGEFDPIEKFGVAMKQSEINARLAAEGMADLEGEELLLASAQTRLTMLFERAGDSVGAYARASNTLYVAQQQLNAVISNMQVAFGASLQEPIAKVINQFTEMAEKYGPEVAEIGEAIGVSIENLAPLFAVLSETFFLLIAPLESVVRGLGTAAGLISQVLTPTVGFLNLALEDFNTLLTFLAIKSDEAWESLGKTNKEGSLFLDWLNEVLGVEDTIAFFDSLPNSIRDAGDAMQEVVDISRNNEFTESSRDAAMLASAMRNFANEVEPATVALTYFQNELQQAGAYSKDAEGKLTGLALMFTEIEQAALKSNATEALKEMGFQAAQIEVILTRPDWAIIFGEIGRLARLAALDIATLSYAGAIAVDNARRTLQELMGSFQGSANSSGARSAATDFVKNFYEGLEDETDKQEARIRLRRMGASEGLIEAIVGAQGWEKVFAKVISQGIPGLKKLQAEWNRTAAGIDEATAATEAFEKAQKEALDEAREMAMAYIEEQQRIADELYEAYLRAREAADEFLAQVKEVSTINILPDTEEEIGKFEQAVIGSVDRIRAELKRAFQDKLIYQEDFDAISAFVEAEEFALRRISQQRDDLANRYSLSEALINDYKRALTAGMQLTGILGQLKNETEKRMVTEVQGGIVNLSSSLKEFAVTITRSYEETIEKTQSKSMSLLDGFRNMAQRAREFAENLRTLRDMGLDPMLFNQLVQAGVEAGGETAQALIEGGSGTIQEVNSLFNEINEIGGNLGEEVAATLYGAGIDMTNGLLAGIKSQQEELLELARSMAEAFTAEFNSRISIAVEKPVAAARAASDAAAAAVPKLENIDVEGIAKLNAYLANASKSLNVVSGSATIAGINTKIDVVEQLRDELLAGAKLDLSGIQSGLSSADLIAAARASGSQTVTQVYNVNYGGTGNLVTSYQDGVAFAQGLQTAAASNPNLSVEVFGR